MNETTATAERHSLTELAATKDPGRSMTAIERGSILQLERPAHAERFTIEQQQVDDIWALDGQITVSWLDSITPAEARDTIEQLQSLADEHARRRQAALDVQQSIRDALRSAANYLDLPATVTPTIR